VGDESTWPFLLQSNVLESDIEAEFINAGAAGAAMVDILPILENKVSPLSPDYLILFSAYNNRAYFKSPWYWKGANYLNDISWLFVLTREWIGLNYFGDIEALRFGRNTPMNMPLIRENLKTYRDNLEKFKLICQRNNIRLIVGTQPHFLPHAYKDYRDLQNSTQVRTIEEKIIRTGEATDHELQYLQMALMNFEISDFAKDNNLLLFDGISIFPEKRENFFIDQIHFNEKGTKRLSKNLFNFLIEKKVINHKVKGST
jgi:hypothetical protein